MTRYEILGLFTALDELMEEKAYDGVRRVIKRTIALAENEKYIETERSKEDATKEK